MKHWQVKTYQSGNFTNKKAKSMKLDVIQLFMVNSNKIFLYQTVPGMLMNFHP